MTTETRSDNSAPAAGAGTIETKLEVIVLPVSDVERTKRFYGGRGWRVDADFTNGPDWRVLDAWFPVPTPHPRGVREEREDREGVA
jgi:catechol 2,3-dioxygenase-like lactoylglutathione lyase family enzyme